MNDDRLRLASLFNFSAASGAGLASVLAFQTGHPGVGWLTAGVAVVNLIGAVYPIRTPHGGPSKRTPTQGPT
jgi:hypothetical protein